MKVTKEKAAENRVALVKAAGRLFRERGIDGVGVAEISKTAGLTHGALYAQFPSKDALAAEALAQGLARSNAYIKSLKPGDASGLAEYLDFYLSPAQRDNIVQGCAMAASASEIGRQDKTVSTSFTQGFSQMVATFEAELGDGSSTASRHQRALVIVSGVIGGLAVARATAKADPALSSEILAAMRSVLGEVGGEAPAPARGKAAAPRRKRAA